MFRRKRILAEGKIHGKLDAARDYYESGYIDAGLNSARLALGQACNELTRKHPLIAKSYSTFARGFALIGIYDEALKHYEQARDHLAKSVKISDPLFIDCLHNIAEIYKLMGGPKKQETVLRHILQIQRKAHGIDHPDYASAQYFLSEFYRAVGMYNEALAGYEEASNVYARQSSERGKELRADCQFGAAASHYASGRYAEAEPLFVEALQLYRRKREDTDASVADILQNLATISAFLANPKKAMRLMTEAEDIYNHRIHEIFLRNSTERKQDFLDLMLTSVSRMLSLVVQFFPDDPEVAREAFELIGNRKSLAFDSEFLQRDIFSRSSDSEIIERWAQLEKLRYQITEIGIQGPEEGQSFEEHFANVMKLIVDAQSAERSLLQMPGYDLPVTEFLDFSLDSLDALMPAGTVLIEFVKFRWLEYNPAKPKAAGFEGERYLALTYQTGGPATCTYLGNAQEVDMAIADFRAAIIGYSDSPGSRDVTRTDISVGHDETGMRNRNSGQRVYDLLLRPLVKDIGGSRKLLIATDGEIARLPFDVLPSGDENFMIDHYEISYLGCARDLLRKPLAGNIEITDPVVMASPDYDFTTGRASDDSIAGSGSDNGETLRSMEVQFPPLPATEQEGVTVAELLGVAPILNQQATKGRLLAVQSPRILHLATHGFCLSDPPNGEHNAELGRLGNATDLQALRSGLAMAGANTWLRQAALPSEAMDGILNCDDVKQIELFGTELVVLSACDTGLGDIQSGDGVYGLSRAFSLSGVETQLVSLWKVPDAQTCDLMEHYYRALISGKGRSESLRIAKLAIKRAHPAPLFWGAFICLGKTGPLSDLSTSV